MTTGRVVVVTNKYPSFLGLCRKLGLDHKATIYAFQDSKLVTVTKPPRIILTCGWGGVPPSTIARIRTLSELERVDIEEISCCFMEQPEQ